MYVCFPHPSFNLCIPSLAHPPSASVNQTQGYIAGTPPPSPLGHMPSFPYREHDSVLLPSLRKRAEICKRMIPVPVCTMCLVFTTMESLPCATIYNTRSLSCQTMSGPSQALKFSSSRDKMACWVVDRTGRSGRRRGKGSGELFEKCLQHVYFGCRQGQIQNRRHKYTATTNTNNKMARKAKDNGMPLPQPTVG